MEQQTKGLLPSTVSIAVVTCDDAVVDTVAAATAGFDADVSVQTFATENEAVNGISSEETDCVVCTERLRAGDGIGVVAALRNRGSVLPVVLYDTVDDERSVDEAYEAGVSELVDRAGAASERVLARTVRRLLTEQPRGAGGDAHLEAIADAASEAIVTIDADSTIRYVNAAVEEVFGYPPSDLLGEPLTALMSDEMAARHEAGMAEYLQTGKKTLDWDYTVLPGRHRDGREIQLAVSFSEFRAEGDRLFTGIIRDITAQTRQQRQLTAVTQITQDLSGAETRAEICEVVVNAIGEQLDAPAASISLYDGDSGLETVAEFPSGAGVGEGLSTAEGSAPMWQAFTTYDEVTCTVTELSKRVDPAPQTGVCVPLGRYGVLVWTTTERSLSDRERNVVRILCGSVTAALERADREESLRKQTASLTEQTESLQRTESLNAIVRGCIDAVIAEDTEGDVLRNVCEQITSNGPFEFAWFGQYDPISDEITPEASAGHGGGYLNEMSVTADNSLGQGPTGTAINSRSVQVQNDIVGDPPFEPWRQTTLERGFRSVLAVPVSHRETQYGVLVVYATEIEAFDTRERETFESVGELAGFALTASRRTPVPDAGSTVELGFEVTDDIDPVRLAAVADDEIEFERFARNDEGVQAFVRIPGQIDDSLDALTNLTAVRDVSVVTREAEESRVEILFDGDGFFGTLSDRGVVLRNGTANASTLRLLVEFPDQVGLEPFVDWVRHTYAEVELFGRRKLDRSARIQRRFRSMVERSLTSRQLEVLQTAYYGGYFEWPRDQTGQDIADSLGISQPTVNRHLRAAERKLLTLLYEGK
ncbi:GAF domain-containing protein [Halostella sp. PRR32]|uniref:GAF domain-containing protein n=1 Tax=Halostella sp. PRR32 TaxID=3098147 RepID=UPI002B1D5EDB|nr:GAF domain-containing protein [Halostella sp. PRR32]